MKTYKLLDSFYKHKETNLPCPYCGTEEPCSCHTIYELVTENEIKIKSSDLLRFRSELGKKRL